MHSCRFQNVCPEWQQEKLARQPGSTVPPSVSAAALQAAASEGGLSSRGLGHKGLHTLDTGRDAHSETDAEHSADLSGDKPERQEHASDQENGKDCRDIFQNGEEDEFMILDVVMNVVSDEVVLGFFHIDGRKFVIQEQELEAHTANGGEERGPDLEQSQPPLTHISFCFALLVHRGTLQGLLV